MYSRSYKDTSQSVKTRLWWPYLYNIWEPKSFFFNRITVIMRIFGGKHQYQNSHTYP